MRELLAWSPTELRTAASLLKESMPADLGSWDEDPEDADYAAPEQVPVMGPDEQALHDLVTDAAAALVTLGLGVNAGTLGAAAFASLMRRVIADLYLRAYRAGMAAGVHRLRELGIQRPLVVEDLAPTDQATLKSYLSAEAKYIDRFAAQVKAGEVSPAEVLARTDMYADSVRAIWWQGMRSRFAGQRVLVWYDASDDNRTCLPCLSAAADSPYRPEDAPIPGADTCLGLDRCRCALRFEVVEDPDPADAESSLDLI